MVSGCVPLILSLSLTALVVEDIAKNKGPPVYTEQERLAPLVYGDQWVQENFLKISDCKSNQMG